MKPIATILFIILGVLAGYYFKEEITMFKYYHIPLPILFGIAVFSIVYRKYRNFKNKTFISSKFDITRRIMTLMGGIGITTAVLYYWIPNSYFHWLFLLVGVIGLLSGLFYEKSIQLTNQNGLLTIEFASKGKSQINLIDSYELENGTLKIFSDQN